jgi:hypothetical protein
VIHLPVFLPSHDNFPAHNIAAIKNTKLIYKQPMEDVCLPNAMAEWLCLGSSYFVFFMGPVISLRFCSFSQSLLANSGIAFLIGHDKMVKVRIYYTIISPVSLYEYETFSSYF